MQGAVHGSHWAFVDVTPPLPSYIHLYMYIYNIRLSHYDFFWSCKAVGWKDDNGVALMVMIMAASFGGNQPRLGCESVHFCGWMWLIVLQHTDTHQQ